MEINYELSIDDVLAFPRFQRRRNILLKPYAFMIPPAIAALLWLWQPSVVIHSDYGLKGKVTTEIGDFWTEFLTNTIAFTGLLLLIRHSATKQLKNFYLRNTGWKGPRNLQITEDKLIAKGKYMVCEIDPAMIQKIEEGRDHVFIYLDQDEAWTIPKRHLPSNITTQHLRETLLPSVRPAT